MLILGFPDYTLRPSLWLGDRVNLPFFIHSPDSPKAHEKPPASLARLGRSGSNHSPASGKLPVSPRAGTCILQDSSGGREGMCPVGCCVEPCTHVLAEPQNKGSCSLMIYRGKREAQVGQKTTISGSRLP